MSAEGQLRARAATEARPPEPRRRNSGAADYASLVTAAANQLAGELPPAPSGPTTVVVVPIVGFGGQSRSSLDRTLSLLAAPAMPAPQPRHRQVVLVVNRPAHRLDDGTAATARRAVARQRQTPGAPSMACCELGLLRRPRIGELRQVGVDAVEAVWGRLPAGSVVLAADDDIVALPEGTLAGVEDRLTSDRGMGAAVAVGPVLFDHSSAPACMFVELFAADLLRALIADWQLGVLAGDLPGPIPAPEVFDSLVLSCHLGVRIEALRAAGGFTDLNELTELLRATAPGGGVGRPVPLAGSNGDPIATLLSAAVRVSSRRALAAWAGGHHPTVAQWKAHRLRAARVDPVRVQPLPPVPPALDDDAAPGIDVNVLEGVLATVCDYLAPPPEAVRWALKWLGLEPSDVVLRPAVTATGWQVRVRRTEGLAERLVALQRAEMAQTGTVAAWPTTGVAG